MKVDVRDGSRSEWRAEGCYPGEPVFVREPGSEGEDDGVVLSVVLDATPAARSCWSSTRARSRSSPAPRRRTTSRSASTASTSGERAGRYAAAAMPSKIFQPGLLDGQVAIVSGGGSGLGRATALELAALGARWWSAGAGRSRSRRPPARPRAGACRRAACDIREEDQVDALVDGVLERHGQIDLLVNNAGGQYLTPAEDITPKGFRTVIRLNVEGTWLMTHAVATRAMIPRRRLRAAARS